MRKLVVSLTILTLILVTLSVMMADTTAVFAGPRNGGGGGSTTIDSFLAHLNGSQEVPPVSTRARGFATFDVNFVATPTAQLELEYKVYTWNTPNVVAAHIHCGSSGVNGPVGVTLFSNGPTTVNGLLTSGTATQPDANNGCGWMDIADVTQAMQGGDTYVNVHTVAHPPGQIRGQIH